MEIPYEVTARPDTGLWNAKLGIWLFLASEVMLFGGLFSAYIFLRLGADHWPHGLLNVPLGFTNTLVLIGSSVTMVLAWAALKMRQFGQYRFWLGITILCGCCFLVIKSFEYRDKFHHYGVFIKAASYPKYADELEAAGALPVYHSDTNLWEVTGHLEKTPDKELLLMLPDKASHSGEERNDIKKGTIPDPAQKVQMHPDSEPGEPQTIAFQLKDIQRWGNFIPKYSSYFAIYFTLTGLHALHVIGGMIVMTYFFLFGHILYRTNPEHQSNRIEVLGLFWHFVDLVWIFLFPVLYLL